MRPGRLTLVAVAIAAGLVLVQLLRPTTSGEPFDLRNPGPDGLAAIADVLREVGVASTQGHRGPGNDVTRVLVPVDRMTDADRDDLLDWVADGGVLVVADPWSPLHGLVPASGFLGDPSDGEPACDVPALAEVTHVDLPAWQGLAEPDEDDRAGDGGGSVVARCFPLAADRAWMTVIERGRGHVVALGSLDPLVNARIADADHVVLAAALLGPSPQDRLHVVTRPPPGAGDRGILDLVPGRVYGGLLLGALALALLLVRLGRRLGPPVPERLPPVLPGAELARSVGALLQRADGRQGAASRLRRDARRTTALVLGVPPATAPAQLTDLATVRLGLPREVASTALLDTPIRDDEALVAVAQATSRVRHAAHAGRDVPAATSTNHPDPATEEPLP